MGDPLKKPQAGDSAQPSAKTQSLLIDSARDYARRSSTQSVDPAGPRDRNTVRIKNTTPDRLPRFSVLALDGPIYGPTDNLEEFKNNVAFNGIEPRFWHKARFAIIAVPLDPGDIGDAKVHDISQVQVEVEPGQTNWGFADVFDSRTDVLRMREVDAGAMVLWKESGTGIKWAVVRISNPNTLYT